MAGKLSQGQKAGLIFGGAVLAALLIVGKAEGTFDGLTNRVAPPKRKVPQFGSRATGPAPSIEPGGYAGKGAPMHTVNGNCDPLDWESRAPYVGCYDIDGKWVIMPEFQGTQPPEIGQNEIGISADYSHFKIGDFWFLKTLHPFLEMERQEGRLSTLDEDAGSISRFLYDDPVSFINGIFGQESEGVTVGDFVYTTAIMLATAGTALKFRVLLSEYAGAKVAALTGATLPIVTKWTARAAKAGGVLEAGSVVNYGIEALYQGTHSEEMAKAWDDHPMWTSRDEMRGYLNDLVVHAVEAFWKLLETQNCIWGYKERKSMKLADLPYGDNEAVMRMFQDIFLEILLFQRRDFSYNAEDYL